MQRAVLGATGSRRRAPRRARPPPSTCAVRSTSSATRPAFHAPHAAGPVASESASVSAASSSRRAARRRPPRRPASIVAGSSRSRRVATSGSSRWCRTSATSVSTSAGGKPMRGADLARPAPCRPRCGRRGSPCRCRAAACRRRAGRAGRPGRRARRRSAAASHEVPVDGEAVVGVALRPAARRLPLRQHPHQQAPLVERLDDPDGARARRAAARRARSRASAGHGSGSGGASAASRSSDAPVDRRAVRGRRRRAARSDEHRVVGRVGVGGDVRPRRRAARALGASGRSPARRRARAGPRSDDADRARQVSSLVHAIVRAAAATSRHQRVGVVVAERVGDRVLLLEQQAVAGPAGAAVQLDPRGEQRRRRRRRSALVVAVEQDRAAPPRAQPRAWTSRSPPRPSFRSGSSRKATSPARAWRSLDRAGPARRASAWPASASCARPRVGQLVGEARRRRRRGGRRGATWRCRGRRRRAPSASFTVRTAWPSFSALVPDRVPDAARPARPTSAPARRGAAARRCRCAAQLAAGRSRRRRRGRRRAAAGLAGRARPSSARQPVVDQLRVRAAPGAPDERRVVEQRLALGPSARPVA